MKAEKLGNHIKENETESNKSHEKHMSNRSYYRLRVSMLGAIFIFFFLLKNDSGLPKGKLVKYSPFFFCRTCCNTDSNLFANNKKDHMRVYSIPGGRYFRIRFIVCHFFSALVFSFIRSVSSFSMMFHSISNSFVLNFFLLFARCCCCCYSCAEWMNEFQSYCRRPAARVRGGN